ncbi:hypothetical protein ACTFPI_13370 [Bacillus cereus group sp. MYBKT14-2]
MLKTSHKQDGLKCDVVIYIETVQLEDVTTTKNKTQMKQVQQKINN